MPGRVESRAHTCTLPRTRTITPTRFTPRFADSRLCQRPQRRPISRSPRESLHPRPCISTCVLLVPTVRPGNYNAPHCTEHTRTYVVCATREACIKTLCMAHCFLLRHSSTFSTFWLHHIYFYHPLLTCHFKFYQHHHFLLIPSFRSGIEKTQTIQLLLS